MRILTWNILHGGGPRRGQILKALLRHDADVLVLTEFRASYGGLALAAQLRNHGYGHQFLASSKPTQNSVFVASKLSASLHEDVLPTPELLQRCLPASVAGIRLLGLYFPMGRKKVPLFEHLLRLPSGHIKSPTMLIGDFNTGRHRLDEAGATFVASEYFDGLEAAGWIDAWRHHHPDAREYSWFSGRGNGFRVDHVFCSPALLRSVRSVGYSHAEREARVSDHSIMLVDLEMGGG